MALENKVQETENELKIQLKRAEEESVLQRDQNLVLEMKLELARQGREETGTSTIGRECHASRVNLSSPVHYMCSEANVPGTPPSRTERIEMNHPLTPPSLCGTVVSVSPSCERRESIDEGILLMDVAFQKPSMHKGAQANTACSVSTQLLHPPHRNGQAIPLALRLNGYGENSVSVGKHLMLDDLSHTSESTFTTARSDISNTSSLTCQWTPVPMMRDLLVCDASVSESSMCDSSMTDSSWKPTECMKELLDDWSVGSASSSGSGFISGC